MEDSRFQNRPVNPLDERKVQGSKKTFLGSLYGRIALVLYNGTTDKAALSESDGKLTASVYGKAGSTSTAISVETTGEQKVTNYGKASSTITAFATEATGEQKTQLYGKATATIVAVQTETAGELKVVNYGKDSGGALDAFRTNDNLQLFYEPYEHWRQVDPYLMTNADAIAYSPGSAAAETYSVIVTLYNLTAGSINATVYVDVAAGGTAGNAEYLANAEALAAKTRLTLPELIIGGDDDIRAFASAIDSINMHFKVKQVART